MRYTYELGMYFECHLAPGSEPRLPDRPDPHQTAVRWIPLEQLADVRLLPRMADEVRAALAWPRQVDPLIRP